MGFGVWDLGFCFEGVVWSVGFRGLGLGVEARLRQRGEGCCVFGEAVGMPLSGLITCFSKVDFPVQIRQLLP